MSISSRLAASLALLALAVTTGCVSEYHVLVTSEPPGQQVSVVAYHADNTEVQPIAHTPATGSAELQNLTPYEFHFRESIYAADVTVTFSDGEVQTKRILAQSIPEKKTTNYAPFGIPLGFTEEQRGLKSATVHVARTQKMKTK